MNQKADRSTTPSATPAPRLGPHGELSFAQCQEYVKRAQAGDPSALAYLRDLLDANPHIWKDVLDLVAMVEKALIQKLGGGDPMSEESFRRQVKALKGDLIGPQPNPLDKLLVDRIAAAWLPVAHAEQAAAKGGPDAPTSTRLSAQQLDAANRRFLASVKALAQVRRLAAGLKLEVRYTTEPPPAPPSASASTSPRMTTHEGEEPAKQLASRLPNSLGQQTPDEGAALA